MNYNLPLLAGSKHGKDLSARKLPSAWLAVPLLCLACALPIRAQLSQPEPDPLARIRAAAKAHPQACSASGETLCEEVAPKIIANALGKSPLEENLRRLTQQIGGRLTGTASVARAVSWAVAAFRAAVIDVHTEKYQIPATWTEGASSLEILSPSSFPVSVVSVGWAAATPRGGVTARVVFAGEGSAADFARLGPAAKGALLLVHSKILTNWNDLFQEYMTAPGIIRRAKATGAAAILWMSTREGMLLHRHSDTLTGQIEPLPQAIVARDDALRLESMLETGETVRARLELPNRIGGPTEQENVVAVIRGRIKPAEWVLLGAHLDSWDLGQGALDDGCNAAMVVEAARDIARIGVRPRRSIRFVLFTGEEQGRLGSWAYVRAHRAELDLARAAIIFDEGTGRVTGYSLGGRRDIAAGVRKALKPLAPRGVTSLTFGASLGTDNLDFLLEGVPTLVADQEEANYIRNYHASSDRFDNVDVHQLKLNTAIAAVTAFDIAESETPIGPRLSRSEIAGLLKRTGLDDQMKIAGIWALWESGERGRRP